MNGRASKVKELAKKLHKKGVAASKADAHRMAESMISTSDKIDKHRKAKEEGEKEDGAEIIHDTHVEIQTSSRKVETTTPESAKKHADSLRNKESASDMVKDTTKAETVEEDTEPEVEESSDSSDSDSPEEQVEEPEEPAEEQQIYSNEESEEPVQTDTSSTEQQDSEAPSSPQSQDTPSDESRKEIEEKMKSRKESKIDLGSIFKSG